MLRRHIRRIAAISNISFIATHLPSSIHIKHTIILLSLSHKEFRITNSASVGLGRNKNRGRGKHNYENTSDNKDFPKFVEELKFTLHFTAFHIIRAITVPYIPFIAAHMPSIISIKRAIILPICVINKECRLMRSASIGIGRDKNRRQDKDSHEATYNS